MQVQSAESLRQATRLREVQTEQAFTPPQPQIPQASATDEASIALLRVALMALGNRAVIAIAGLRTVSLVASVWALFWRCLPSPSNAQLTGLGLYAAFVLTVEVIVRRK